MRCAGYRMCKPIIMRAFREVCCATLIWETTSIAIISFNPLHQMLLKLHYCWPLQYVIINTELIHTIFWDFLYFFVYTFQEKSIFMENQEHDNFHIRSCYYTTKSMICLLCYFLNNFRPFINSFILIILWVNHVTTNHAVVSCIYVQNT